MTPVATPVALRAHTWDAALEETLSGGSDAPAVGVAVHSVHRSVVNIRRGAALIALAHERLDDAPWTVRISERDWPAVASARAGDDVLLADDAVVLRPADDEVRIVLDPRDRRVLGATTGIPSTDSLRGACAVLDAVPSPAATTPFGALAADALAAGIHRLQASARELIATDAPDAADATAAAAERLLGLGEGLTPSGDDVLTGLAFVAAHPGFGLSTLLAPLRAAAATAHRRTTQLSEVTLRAALGGRARRRMHDLMDAVISGDAAALRTAVAGTAEIGHTSGHDILTGIRLGVVLAASHIRPIPSDQGDHR
ncbi:DUF2877 domain-containing protein [Microbacterium esteraromaticum]|uniref:DUF2877 domain-containing protein n=1 Tax=Microbacterium esteraromaticum TaxID=57043 RepID=A0A7D8AHF9_9MICO|nr:DUF2877 domain-containing protein [Microbacterium esteraromaticum]QMU97763.1 DUF2877 domain-containing protein [Microbacterium esteraromaticum]